MLGTAMRAPLVEAALANGMAAHADESDDSHEDSQTHPGCGVVPAALAAAEDRGAPVSEFLAATVLGYEMTTRFAEAIGSAMTFKASSLSSHAYGPLFGAGYAAGALMRFDEARFMALLNYLAQEASGLTTWRLDERAYAARAMSSPECPRATAPRRPRWCEPGFTGGGDVLDLQPQHARRHLSRSRDPTALTMGSVSATRSWRPTSRSTPSAIRSPRRSRRWRK